MTDIMVDIYSCGTTNINILYLTQFSARSSISKLGAVMPSDDYGLTYGLSNSSDI